MTVTINGTTGVSLVQDGVIVANDLATSFPPFAKNKIINGDFQVWQRGTSISIPIGPLVYCADRWASFSAGAAGNFSVFAGLNNASAEL